MKRIVTDRPDLVGWMDGFNAGSNGDRTSRSEQLPEDQQEAYTQNFRKGAKDGFKSNS